MEQLTTLMPHLDADGALAETGGALDGQTRAAFFKRAGLAAGSLAGAGALMGAIPSLASASVPTSDVAILNFALTLEYLEATFYAQAAKNFGSGTDAFKQFAGLVASHEAAHVKALKSVLGAKAVGKPKFDFGNAVTDQSKFVHTAYVLENTGVHAYLGQAGKIKTPAILAAAASIVTIEARHAAAIALIINGSRLAQPGGITPSGAFDKPLTKAQILKAVKGTGFIVG